MAKQQRLEDAAGEAFEATLSESDESDKTDEEEEDTVPKEKKPSAAEGGSIAIPPISAEELENNRQDFQTIMRVSLDPWA